MFGNGPSRTSDTSTSVVNMFPVNLLSDDFNTKY
jgi:hypothetical protein